MRGCTPHPAVFLGPWGHGADPVAPATVAAVLRDVERVQPFTAEELEEVE